MKNILITGINGFIGSALFEKLKDTDNVVGIAKNNTGNKNIHLADLSIKGAGVRFLHENKFDIIIHLATIMANPGNINSLGVFDQNMQIHKNLLEGLKKNSGCHLINFSSSAVYPNVSGTYAENDEINPAANNDCLYGLAKFNSEILFKHLLPKSIDQLHLRVGFVYGENMDPSRIHKKFSEELREQNSITVFGNGERSIPQIEINSLINKISFFIENRTTGCLNVADENITLEDLAKRTIEEHGNIQSSIIYKKEGNSSRCLLNLEKIHNLFK